MFGLFSRQIIQSLPVTQDQHINCIQIAKDLDITHTGVWDQLRNAGYAKKFDIWVLHNLAQKNLPDSISLCEFALNRNKVDPCFKRMVIGDEKWATYDNNIRKRSWSKIGEAPQTVTKTGLTARNALLFLW